MSGTMPRRAEAGHRSRVTMINVVSLVGIAGVIGWKGVLLLQSRWDRTESSVPSMVPAPVEPAAVTRTPADSEPLVIPKGNDSSISPVPLKLILVHTRPGRTPREGLAQIGVVRETPQTYLAGAVLENGARLVEIYSDRVRLEKNGRFAWLKLQGLLSWEKTESPELLHVGGYSRTPPTVVITSREPLTDYIRPSPVYDGTTLLGFTVYAGKNGGPFSQMGLQGGDLIVALNGVPLAEPNTGWDALRSLMDGGVFSAVIQRRGNEEQLTLDGSILVRAEEDRIEPPWQGTPLPAMRQVQQ